MNELTFTRRNEKGLHCRFCNEEHESDCRNPRYIDLFETSPIKGIVCKYCKEHLSCYIKEIKPEQSNQSDLVGVTCQTKQEQPQDFPIMFENKCPKCRYPEMYVIEKDRSMERLGDCCVVMCPRCEHKEKARIVLIKAIDKLKELKS